MTIKVFCDFNDRLGPTTYGLRVNGVRRDLERQGLQLTLGLKLLLYDYDGFDDGYPAWLIANAVVTEDPSLGFLAEVDADSFRWVVRRGNPDDDLHRLGTFRVDSGFGLEGRGGVLTGIIVRGSLQPGQVAAVKGSDGRTQLLEISSVEFVDEVSTGRSSIGLLFAGEPACVDLTLVAPTGSLLEFA